MNKVTDRPDLAAWGMLLVREALSKTNCHKIATVQSFNSTQQSITATINYKSVINGAQDDFPVLLDVPMIVLGGGFGSYLSFPDPTGEVCLILYNDEDMTTYISSGQNVAPNTNRKHAFPDAIAIVGLSSFANAISGYDATCVTFEAGSTLINLKNEVTTLKAVINGLIDAIATFTATGVVSSGPGSGGTLTFAAGLTAFDLYKTTVGTLLK